MPDYRFDPTLPYQIPLGALVSPTLPNLIAAAKNLSVTHLTNGAYRLHPVEWNIGESAGTLAAFCLKESCTPGAVYSDEQLLHRFQHCLLERGIPIAWTLDITSGTPNFALLQKCLLRAPFPAGTRRFTRLDVRPAEPIDCGEAAALLEILSPARITSIQDILTSWHANPGVQLEGRALDRIIALLSFPHEPVPDWPSYLDLAKIIAPFL
jgi:hypothetical protein